MQQQLVADAVRLIDGDDAIRTKLTAAADLVEQAARLVTEVSNQSSGDLRRSMTRDVSDELTWAMMDLEILAALFSVR